MVHSSLVLYRRVFFLSCIFSFPAWLLSARAHSLEEEGRLRLLFSFSLPLAGTFTTVRSFVIGPPEARFSCLMAVLIGWQ